MTVQALTIIEDPVVTRDRVFVARQLPLFSGNGDENLACGKCGELVARNVAVSTLYSNLNGHERVIVTCTCGAHNLLLTERRSSPR